MDHKHFIKSLDWINRDLAQLKVNRTNNSIGWHVFFEFGKNLEIPLPSGKIHTRKEWKIWIANASWRITKDEQYVVGSGEDPKISLQKAIQILLEKQFISLSFISPFLDAEFSFDDGYKISTFFNWHEENQWLIFLPNRTEITVDCSTEQAIEETQNLSQELVINPKYTKTPFLLDATVSKIAYNGDGSFTVYGPGDFVLETAASAWRILKDGKYLTGRLDCCFEESKASEYKEKLSQLKNKKIKSIEMDASKTDARFLLEEGYSIETFKTAKDNQWNFSSPTHRAHLNL